MKTGRVEGAGGPGRDDTGARLAAEAERARLVELERLLVRLRWFGVALGTFEVLSTYGSPALGPPAPAHVRPLGLALIGGLAALNAILVPFLRGRREVRSLRRAGLAALLVDGLTLAGLTWLYSFDRGTVAWTLLFIVTLEGGFRYGLGGASATVAALLPLEVLREVWRMRAYGFPLDPVNAPFRIGIMAIVAFAAGAVAEALERERRRGRAQAEELGRFRPLVESSEDAILTKTREGLVATWNGGAKRLFGYSADEIVGRSVGVLVPAHLAGEERRILERVLAGERIEHFETERLRKDGTIAHVSLSVSPILTEAGEVGGASSIARDITRRKRAEEALRERERELADAQAISHVGSSVWDIESNALAVSAEMVRIYGLEPRRDRITHEDFLDRVHPDDRDAAVDAIVGSLRTGDPFSLEHRVVRPGGSLGWVHVRGRVVMGESGPVRLDATAQDVTDQKRVQEALAAAYEKVSASMSELARRNHEVTLINEMGEMLQGCTGLEEAYRVIARFGQRLFPGWSGAAFVIAPSRERLEAVAAWGDAPAEAGFPPDHCWGLRRGRVHAVDRDEGGPPCLHLGNRPTERSLCLSMIAHGDAVGLLQLAALAQPEWVRQRTVPELRPHAVAVAEHLALALANFRLRETLRNESIRDPLTGLFNRRYMEESLEREFRRALRSGSQVGVVAIDIDHFKAFNDTFGHDAGDALLRGFAERLRRHVRGEDIACRCGGEEFLLILPDCREDVAVRRAEELRLSVSGMQVPHRDGALGAMTISLGVAAFPAHAATPEEVLRVADLALYRAKGEGRDRVVVAPLQQPESDAPHPG